MCSEKGNSDKKIYYLGIDGGGTKTDFILEDDCGNVLGEYRTTSTNPFDIGIEEAKRILKEGIYKICDGIPFSSVSVFAGISGGTVSGMKIKLKEFFDEFGFYCVENDSDNKNIIAAGLGKKDGITVVLGTGICVFTQINQKHTRMAGWGYLIDNGGSGYNLGRDALSAYFAALDKSGKPTLLTEEIDKIYPEGAQKLIGYIYEGGKKTIASFAPAVFYALERGDEVAMNILKRNTQEVAHLIKSAAKLFGSEKIPIVLAGGLTRQPCVTDYIKRALCDNRFVFETSDCAPVYGAVKLARELREEREKV